MNKIYWVKYSFLLLLILTSCKKEKTSWDSNYKLVLVNDTLQFQNITKDSLFAAGGSGELRFSFEKELYNMDISEMVNIPDTTIIQKYVLSVNSINVPPGYSFVNQVKDHVFNMNGAKLTYAGVKSGTATLEVQNPYPTDATFDVSLPKVTKDNVALMKTFVVGKGTPANPTKASVTIDLSGYNINLTGTSGTSFNSIQTTLKITSDPNGQAVSVTNQDTTNFKATFKNLKVDRAKGYFGVMNNQQSFQNDVKFFDKLSGFVDISDYNMSLILENSCKIEGLMKVVNLSSYNKNTNTTVDLTHQIIGNPIFMEAATGDWWNVQSYQRTFTFLPNNSNLNSFLGNLGSQIKGNIELKINPNGDTYSGWNELFSTSRVKLKLKADMPIKIAMNNLQFKDTFAIDFKNQTEKTHIKNGKFILEATNAYPIEFTPTITFLDINNQVVGQLTTPSKVRASTGGTITYNGLTCEKSTVELELTEELAAKFSEAKKVVVNFKFNTIPAGVNPLETVYLPYNGFIATKLFGDFGINFKLGK